MNHRSALLPFLTVAAAAFALCLHPLLTSAYLMSAADGAILFIVTFLLLVFGYMAVLQVVWRRVPEKGVTALAVLLFALLLQSANSVMLPLLDFTSSSSTGGAISDAEDYLVYTLCFAFGLGAAWLVSSAGPYLLRTAPKPVLFVTSGINLLMAGLLIVFNSHGGTTTLFGYQVGLPLVAWMFLSFTAYYHLFLGKRDRLHLYLKNERTEKALAFFCCATLVLLALTYAYRHEFGLLSYAAASVLLWFFFYLPNKSRRLFRTLLIGVGVLLAAVLVYYNVLYHGEHWDGLTLGSKIDRMFHPGDQAAVAAQIIQSAGMFGNKVHQFLPWASSDFSIAATTHYVGWAWLILVLLAMIFLVTAGNEYFRRDSIAEGRPIQVLPCLSFLCILLMSLYNIMANIGLTGIIGINCFASGKGIMSYLLSGMLLGFVLTPSRDDGSARIPGYLSAFRKGGRAE